MKLHTTKHDNCVYRAISTARVILGLSPDIVEPEYTADHYNQWILNQLEKNFPGHRMYYWAQPGSCHTDNKEIIFMGDNIQRAEDCPLNDEDYIFMFAYSNGGERGHMVIGYPGLGLTTLHFCVAIEI